MCRDSLLFNFLQEGKWEELEGEKDKNNIILRRYPSK